MIDLLHGSLLAAMQDSILYHRTQRTSFGTQAKTTKLSNYDWHKPAENRRV